MMRNLLRFLIQNRVAFSGLDIQFVGEAEDGEAGIGNLS